MVQKTNISEGTLRRVPRTFSYQWQIMTSCTTPHVPPPILLGLYWRYIGVILDYIGVILGDYSEWFRV